MLKTIIYWVKKIPCPVLSFLRQLWSLRRYPPGPLPLPLIGSLWRFGIRLSPDAFIEMAKQYGNVYTLRIGLLPVVVLSGFQAVKEALINHEEDFVDRPVTPFLRTTLKGRGIVFSNGHTWRQQRRFGVATLRKLGLGKKGMEHQIEEAAHRLVEVFANSKGQPFDPSVPITKSISSVICALTFGNQLSTDDENFKRLLEILEMSLQFGGSFFHGLYELFPWLMQYLPGTHKKIFAAYDEAIAIVQKEIEKHREQHSLTEPQDYIDFYLLQLEKTQNDPYTTYDEANLVECILDFFGAGTETTASTLKWGMLLIAIHPEVQDKVYREMEDVFGSSHSISYQDRKKLPYTNAVIHEIQRAKYILLFGPPRQSVKDVNILGYPIPKRTFVIPDLRSVLYDPKQWETPREFNPNHFLDKDGNFVAREEFLAFGAGARACIGEQMARIELFIFFTSLLRAFSFYIPEVKKLNKEPVTALTMHPRPYKLCAVPRSISS